MDTQNLRFERYDAQGGRVTPVVSLNRGGNIYLSAGLTKKYGIANGTHVGVLLFYDKQQSVVAIKLLHDKEDGMLKMKAGHTGGAFINSKEFAIKYDLMSGNTLKHEYLGQYYPTEEKIAGIGDVLLVDLKSKKG